MKEGGEGIRRENETGRGGNREGGIKGMRMGLESRRKGEGGEEAARGKGRGE